MYTLKLPYGEYKIINTLKALSPVPRKSSSWNLQPLKKKESPVGALLHKPIIDKANFTLLHHCKF